MDRAQALAYWFGRVNFEQTVPLPDDLRLDRIRALLRRLGDPQERYGIVHVAGSKGKGSTSAMLAAILGRAGYRTGLFTSPHLCGVEERIQVDGEPISGAEIACLLEEIQEAEAYLQRRGYPEGCTFFEVATALGFLHFLRRRVEVAVVEVGLGGRFDSTNVCRPLVSLITSISIDHTKQLGDRIGSIAMEKAGIVKLGRPTISGATAGEARPVIEAICRERKAPLRQLGSDFRFDYTPGQVTAEGDVRPRVTIQTSRRAWPTMELGLLGAHQAANAAVAVAGVEELRALGLTVGDGAVAGGLAGVCWPARMEVVGRRPLVVLDCAHNVASVQALVDTLAESFPSGSNGKQRKRLLVLAVSADKDLAGMVRVLGPHFIHGFLTRYTTGTRSATPEQLADLFSRKTQLACTVCQAPAEAWGQAKAAGGPDDLICITGSVFLAGEMRPLLGQAANASAKRR